MRLRHPVCEVTSDRPCLAPAASQEKLKIAKCHQRLSLRTMHFLCDGQMHLVVWRTQLVNN